jgi:hypothetical protein
LENYITQVLENSTLIKKYLKNGTNKSRNKKT